MDNKEAIKYLIAPIATSTRPSVEYLKQKAAYELAIKALEFIDENFPSAFINYLIEVDKSETIKYWSEQGVKETEYQEYALNSCPNIKVKPYEERRQGKWIHERPNGKTYSDFIYCSECQKPNGFYKTDFCPNCGADMRGDKMINEESLKAWEQDHIEFLTSREMGEWLYRRDKNRDKKESPQGEWIKKSDVICLLEKWADGYSYIEIPTTDAIKAIKNMGEGGDKNV